MFTVKISQTRAIKVRNMVKRNEANKEGSFSGLKVARRLTCPILSGLTRRVFTFIRDFSSRLLATVTNEKGFIAGCSSFRRSVQRSLSICYA